MTEPESSAPKSTAPETTAQTSQLSAMFDDALPGAECELLAKRLSGDPALQRQWGRYALIGAALRGDPVCARRAGDDVAARVAAALAADSAPAIGVADDGLVPLPQVAGAGIVSTPRWRRPLAATGIAAGVAALSLVWLQRVDGPASDAASLAARDGAAPAAISTATSPSVEVVAPATVGTAALADAGEVVLAPSASSEPESYVVPVLPADGVPRPVASAQLANFVVAHSEFSGSLARRGMLSALVAGDAAPEPANAAAQVPPAVERAPAAATRVPEAQP